MRRREGAACAADIRAQLAQLAQHHAAIRAAAPVVLSGAVQKFQERMAKLLEQARPRARSTRRHWNGKWP